MESTFRKGVLDSNIRADGRKSNEVRAVSCEVGILPRAHGSGLFSRGQTQILTTTTLGSLGLEQKLDTISPVVTKRYMHHYNFPPFSVGEVRRLNTGRREIGHGALAERALEPVIPSREDFPYALRLVSEALSSNGSTSMGSVCGSTLSLMHAGVPITAPVSGVAMGLIMNDNGEFAILTDIQGIEDHLGDMDFKVAGTSEGITALQMDIKVKGITNEIMEKALNQAKEARLFILDKMLEVMPEVSSNMSPYAPRVERISVPVEKIGAIIGPGGKMIRSIMEFSGASIDIEDDGSVFISAPTTESLDAARGKIEGLTKEAEVGAIYQGKVVRLMDFGAFIEIMPGKDGLCHISELDDKRVEKVEDAVNVDDIIEVMVIEVDRLGRINLSHRAVLQGLSVEEVQAARQKDRERSGPPRRNFDGPSSGGRGSRPQRR
jgi:polyribonucleotide nucleotidyltransferase